MVHTACGYGDVRMAQAVALSEYYSEKRELVSSMDRETNKRSSGAVTGRALWLFSCLLFGCLAV